MYGEFYSRKDSQQTKLERRHRILAKLSCREFPDSNLSRLRAFVIFNFFVALTKNLFVVLDNIWTSSISKKDKLNIIKSVSKMERKNGRLIKNQIPQGTPFFDAITMNGDQLKLKSHYY